MIKTATELAELLKLIATQYKTLYVNGCFGAPMTAANKKYYVSWAGNPKVAGRAAQINAASADTFGFDCCGLIKGALWGWCGNKNAQYGGAKYASNGVPDVNETGLLNTCLAVSSDFAHIETGEYLYVSGHCGIYIGGGLAIECTPAWKSGVQITAVGNIGAQAGYNTRKWTKHGKLPYVAYGTAEVRPSDNFAMYTDAELAKMIIAGDPRIGNGTQRKAALGDRYEAVQAIVNQVMKGETAAEKTRTTHVVQKGETLSGIAKQYGTTYQKIAADNGIKNPSLITVGQKLTINA